MKEEFNTGNVYWNPVIFLFFNRIARTTKSRRQSSLHVCNNKTAPPSKNWIELMKKWIIRVQKVFPWQLELWVKMESCMREVRASRLDLYQKYHQSKEKEWSCPTIVCHAF
jgi:hypothetical protein